MKVKSKFRPDRDAAVRDAERRLRPRFGPDQRFSLWPPEAVRQVASALDSSCIDREREYAHRPKPTAVDLADALTLVEQAREDAALRVDSNELELIEAARAAGLSWEQIGVALGYEPRNAAGSARRRHRWLRDTRFPSFEYDGPREYAIDTGAVTSGDDGTGVESVSEGR